jgi:hypothetical protein
MLLKSCLSTDILTFSFCNKKRLAIRHIKRPLFAKTLQFHSRTLGSRSGYGLITVPSHEYDGIMTALLIISSTTTSTFEYHYCLSQYSYSKTQN